MFGDLSDELICIFRFLYGCNLQNCRFRRLSYIRIHCFAKHIFSFDRNCIVLVFKIHLLLTLPMEQEVYLFDKMCHWSSKLTSTQCGCFYGTNIAYNGRLVD